MGGASGYSGTPLVRKLGLAAGMRVRLLGPPNGYWRIVGVEPGSLELVEVQESGGEKADFTHLFARDEATLDEAFARAREGMRKDGVVWASWPKKSSGVPSEIGRGEVMAAGKKAGLVDIKVCAVDDTWSGLKFVIPVANRR